MAIGCPRAVRGYGRSESPKPRMTRRRPARSPTGPEQDPDPPSFKAEVSQRPATRHHGRPGQTAAHLSSARMLTRPDVLVLGGGGVLGEAWMMGVLAGIEDATGFDL